MRIKEFANLRSAIAELANIEQCADTAIVALSRNTIVPPFAIICDGFPLMTSGYTDKGNRSLHPDHPDALVLWRYRDETMELNQEVSRTYRSVLPVNRDTGEVNVWESLSPFASERSEYSMILHLPLMNGSECSASLINEAVVVTTTTPFEKRGVLERLVFSIATVVAADLNGKILAQRIESYPSEGYGVTTVALPCALPGKSDDISKTEVTVMLEDSL